MQPADYKRSIGYDFSQWGNFTEVVSAVPRVRWLRVDTASATPRSAPPHKILDSYNAWVDWRDNARKVRPWKVPSFPLCLLIALRQVAPHELFDQYIGVPSLPSLPAPSVVRTVTNLLFTSLHP